MLFLFYNRSFSYRDFSVFCNGFILPKTRCPRQDSNLRPFAPEANALSPELLGPGAFDFSWNCSESQFHILFLAFDGVSLWKTSTLAYIPGDAYLAMLIK